MMELAFFTMPIHPVGRDLGETLREDRELAIIADRLGFTEGYFGEHITDAAETIANSMMFIAWILSATRDIKLGTGTINMPNHHPARVAAEVAMLDHMAQGRLILGISPGGLMSDAEVMGNLERDRGAIFLEAINQVLEIWEGDAPYDISGEFWSISTERTLIPELGQGYIAKPLQKPHPPIIVTAVAPFSKGVAAAAARGWDPISANFLLPKWVKTHWPKYQEGCEEGGRPADPANWRVAKSIFVANDLNTARRYATEPDGPYYQYYNSIVSKMLKSGRANLFKDDQNAPDESVTVEKAVEDLVIWGTPEKVTDDLLAFQDEVGPFGKLLYAGHDWKDRDLAVASMELLAEKVMPNVNRQLTAREHA